MSAASTNTGVATALPLHSDVRREQAELPLILSLVIAPRTPRSGGAAREPLVPSSEREQQL